MSLRRERVSIRGEWARMDLRRIGIDARPPERKEGSVLAALFVEREKEELWNVKNPEISDLG
jgi:hypothetical protein